MLKEKFRWLYDSENLNDEMMQCNSEGKDISPFLCEIERIHNMPESNEKEEAAQRMEELPVADNYPYFEPDGYAEITATLDTDYTRFREWIGAQIRADFYGYITPGNPCLAASMAFRDASVSHVKNGIYGSMYIAALISVAPCGKEPLWMVETALKQIPATSRLYESIYKTCEMYNGGKKVEEVIDYIHDRSDEKNQFDWCHTIPNAMIVTANLLLYGEDFDSAITNTIMCRFDTDCNGATVGSIVGMMLGKTAIGCKWLNPIKPRLATSIHGYHSFTIDKLVERTFRLILRR